AKSCRAGVLAVARCTSHCESASSERCEDRVARFRHAGWHAPVTVGGTVTGRLDVIACSPAYVAGRGYKACWGRRIETRRGISGRRHVQGTVGGTVTGRLKASVDHVERSLAVMNSPFGEWGSGLEEALQEV